MRELKITPAALADIQEGMDFYNSRTIGLGDSFETVIAAYIEAITEQPHAGTFYKEGVRYRVIRQFPFLILYHFDDETIAVLRVFNTYQSPQLILI